MGRSIAYTSRLTRLGRYRPQPEDYEDEIADPATMRRLDDDDFPLTVAAHALKLRVASAAALRRSAAFLIVKRTPSRLAMLVRMLPFLVVVVLSFVALPGRAAELSEEEKQQGFQSLFNGRDFTGWRFVGKGDDTKEAPNWSVADGLIKLSGGGSPHLSTDREYADFEMRFEWRGVKDLYNSGFYVRSGPKLGSNQINLAKGAEGKFMAKVTGGDPVPKLQKPAGEWNEWRVVVEGEKATFWCNGKQAWEATGLKPAKGYIGLQAEGAALEFRNLRLREIKK